MHGRFLSRHGIFLQDQPMTTSTQIGVTFALAGIALFTSQVVIHAVSIRRRRLYADYDRAIGHANRVFPIKIKR